MFASGAAGFGTGQLQFGDGDAGEALGANVQLALVGGQIGPGGEFGFGGRRESRSGGDLRVQRGVGFAFQHARGDACHQFQAVHVAGGIGGEEDGADAVAVGDGEEMGAFGGVAVAEGGRDFGWAAESGDGVFGMDGGGEGGGGVQREGQVVWEGAGGGVGAEIESVVCDGEQGDGGGVTGGCVEGSFNPVGFGLIGAEAAEELV